MARLEAASTWDRPGQGADITEDIEPSVGCESPPPEAAGDEYTDNEDRNVEFHWWPEVFRFCQCWERDMPPPVSGVTLPL